MPPIIEIHNLGKKYSITQVQRYLALRDVVSEKIKNIFKKDEDHANEFWALQNINLKIERGERIGIIGRNGAGKSTLLKILSKITPPTIGEIKLRGRVASLLEVGTGFHPELTGRENIYLNGSILGLKKKEINCKLEEIIDFSGVDKFIDTPLKHYSSGMQLRLAFSVAAHLEPEILLIDEVLAVGDMEFQKKCIGKMEEISKQHGRTILFVSHNLEAIQKFCERSTLIDGGVMQMDASTKNVIDFYIRQASYSKSAVDWAKEDAPSDGNVRLLQAFVHDQNGNVKTNFSITEPIGITFHYEVINEGLYFTHGINVFNEQGINIFDSHDNYTEVRNMKRNVGIYSATAWIPGNLLADGYFSIGIALFSQQPFNIFIHNLHALKFTILDELSEHSVRGNYSGNYGGLLRPRLNWQAKQISNYELES